MIRLRLVTTVAAVAVALASCGGGEVSADTYASDVCHAFGTWLHSVQKHSGELTKGVRPGASPEEGKEALRGYLDHLVHETEMLNKEVDKAGMPDVEGGEKFAESVVHVSEEAMTSFEEARKKVDTLPTDDPAKFREGASELGSSIRTSLQKVGSEVSQPESAELRSAFRESRECRELTS